MIDGSKFGRHVDKQYLRDLQANLGTAQPLPTELDYDVPSMLCQQTPIRHFYTAILKPRPRILQHAHHAPQYRGAARLSVSRTEHANVPKAGFARRSTQADSFWVGKDGELSRGMCGRGAGAAAQRTEGGNGQLRKGAVGTSGRGSPAVGCGEYEEVLDAGGDAEDTDVISCRCCAAECFA